MRLRILLLLALALFAYSELAYSKRTIVSDDSLDGFEEQSSGDEEAVSDGRQSPMPVRSIQLDVNTGRRVRDENLASYATGPPPLRTQGRSPKAGMGPSRYMQVGAAEVESAHPPYHPDAAAFNMWYDGIQKGKQPSTPSADVTLASIRARVVPKARGKSRRSRDEETEEAQEQPQEPRQRPATPIPPHRAEGEGRRSMILRSDRAKKMRPASPAQKMIEVPVRQPSLIPGVVASDLTPLSSSAVASRGGSAYDLRRGTHIQQGTPSAGTADHPFQVSNPQRAIVPAGTASDSFQLPHIRRAAGSNPDLFQSALTQRAAAAQGGETSSDAFLHSLFQNYRSQASGFDTRTAPFYVNGLRYGRFTSQPRLPDPPAFPHRDPHAGSATVLLPEDVRWTFGQVEHRSQAYNMARNRAYTVDVRRAMARDAQRLYEMEANHLRSNLHNRNELPVHTSDEWRHWVASNGPNVLMSQFDPTRLGEELDSGLVQAQHRLALRIQASDLSHGNAIPLVGEQEKFAANSLVALWTSGKDEALRFVV